MHLAEVIYESNAEVNALFMLIFAVSIVWAFISYLLSSVAMMLLYSKAGHPRPWAAWVPIYNTYVLLKFGGQNPLFFWIYLASSLAGVIPFLGPIIAMLSSVMLAVVIVYALIYINKSFNYHDNLVLWTIFAALATPIWALVVALRARPGDYRPATGPVLYSKDGMPERVW